MVLVHLIHDLCATFGWQPGPVFTAVKQWGGGVFFLISGVSITLGHRHLRRGLAVLGCGMVCTAATAALYALGLAGKEILIYFGTLHCLGLCMLLWPLLGRLPAGGLLAVGVLLTAAGLGLVLRPAVGPFWLLPFGVLPENFATSDYFPLLPYLGIFLLGALLGRRLYPHGSTRFPRAPSGNLLLRFLCGCGRRALPIYLLHQAAISAVLAFVLWLKAA